jgi:hypothetical protein
MSPKSMQDLGLKEEGTIVAGASIEDLPEFGGFEPPPQPGPFRFKLPVNLGGPIWDTMDTPDKTPSQRVYVQFDREHPLEIVQSLGGKYNGQPFHTRLSNNERARGKDKSIIASDMDYLLRALGVKEKPQRQFSDGKIGPDNKKYMELVIAQAGKEFGADLRYSWKCSRDRDIRVRQTDGNVTVVEGKKGCNEAYYNEQVPNNPDGTKPYEIVCQCGALLRAFANLDNLRS